MPRKAREKSKSGIYHIMLRGINQQQIFYEEEDYEKFLKILRETKEKRNFVLYSYCLMGNHIHLLLKEDQETVGETIKRLGLNFVYWYNVKYQRVGHLFQDRFKSEPVETNEYFLTVLRYIHQNPVHAKICKKIDEYKYSSYQEYVNERKFIDTEKTYEIVSDKSFLELHMVDISSKCIDVEETPRLRLTDEQVQKLISKYVKCQDGVEFQKLKEAEKSKCIVKLYNKGASIRQISRLTGTTKKIVEKYSK